MVIEIFSYVRRIRNKRAIDSYGISQRFLDYAYNFQVENGNIIFCHVIGSGKRVTIKFIEIFF